MNYHLIISGETDLDSPMSPARIFGGIERTRRLDLLVELHKGTNPNILRSKNCSLRTDLELMEKAGLVQAQGSSYRPSFFLVLEEEMEFIPEIAREIARGLFCPIQDWFSEIRNCFQQLSISRFAGWDEMGFLLIGYYLLTRSRRKIDLAAGKILEGNPPVRSAGRYFFYLIQTEFTEMLGRFKDRGQGFGNYYCGIFGTIAAEKDGTCPPFGIFPLFKQLGPARGKRLALEVIEAYRDYFFSGQKPPKDIIPFLENLLLLDSQKNPLVPFIPASDEEQLAVLGSRLGTKIGTSLGQYSSSLQNAFYSFPASRYSTFQEFYNWFYYLLADKCLELLVEQGLIALPPKGYQPFLSFNKVSV